MENNDNSCLTHKCTSKHQNIENHDGPDENNNKYQQITTNSNKQQRITTNNNKYQQITTNNNE